MLIKYKYKSLISNFAFQKTKPTVYEPKKIKYSQLNKQNLIDIYIYIYIYLRVCLRFTYFIKTENFFAVSIVDKGKS